MAEYIEREAVLKRLCDMCENEYCKAQKAKRGAEYSECLEFDLIVSEPPVDVAPVRRGRWVHDGQRVNGGVDWYHCSECLHPVAGVYAKRPFCSMCGGKMDLEDHDGK